jgi:hypothetical protein
LKEEVGVSSQFTGRCVRPDGGNRDQETFATSELHGWYEVMIGRDKDNLVHNPFEREPRGVQTNTHINAFLGEHQGRRI